MGRQWLQYQQLFLKQCFHPGVSLVEKALWVSMGILIMLCIIQAYSGYEIGRTDKARLAKLKAQEGLVLSNISATVHKIK